MIPFSQHAPPHDQRHVDWCAAHQAACWCGVRVEGVTTVASAAGQRLHAVIQLGGLEPADVRVELALASAKPLASRAWPGERMCSMQSYDNGAYVFESAPLPAGSSVLDWTIRISPRDSRATPAMEHAVRLAPH